MTNAKPLLAVLKGERQTIPPVWLMRQAGRYLPEYRALRAEKGGFLALVNDSEAAAEVTLQPIRRFGFDGAILFSDILMVPNALGQALSFGVGEGPALVPPLVDHALASLQPDLTLLDPVYATVARVAAALPPQTTFLGFAGSPWTKARRAASPMPIRWPLKRSSRRSRPARSTIFRARSSPASRRCSCSTAGPGACRRRSSSAG